MTHTLGRQHSEFYSQYPIQTIEITTVFWSYYDIGKGKDIIVIFPDIMGTYESWFAYLPLLSKTHRVVIPFYPPIADIEEMVVGLHTFLERKKITTYTLIGSSLGGLFAQMYVRKFPTEVETLFLLATGTSDKFFGIIVFFLYLVGLLLPEKVMSFGVYIIALLCLDFQKDTKGFWRQYLYTQIPKVDTKKSMLAWGKCILQLCWRYKFKPSDLKEWNKPIYLIESTNDLVFNPFTRHVLKRLYPSALCYTLREAKHLVWINRFREISQILLKFIP